MKFNLYFFMIFILFTFTNCKKGIVKEEYYIISKKDSITKAEKIVSQIPPPPEAPQESKWYSDVVFIMDSKNKVFIYQTETTARNDSVDLGYPNYLGLKPENLLTIESDNFNSFIENNNDIFQIIPIPNKNNSNVFFYIASETDTIKNKALNNLWKLLGKTKSPAIFFVRRTTEEENIVLKYKQNGNEYNPESIDWSKKFYNGKVSPFTKDYETLELKTHCLRKAKETFKKHVDAIDM
ncbi:MAG: hypothetical protein Q7T12_06075 [Flavobacterium sp.]|nr:hypothetical protein [Flavobacterium sp.]